MTENDLKLLGRQVGSKARAADKEMTKPRDCWFCKHGSDCMGYVVCKFTGMPISDTRGGCHKFEERINYE